MRCCLSSTSFAILVNGNAKGWKVRLRPLKVLRQGDLFSPFLFTLGVDVLSKMMIRAEESGLIEGFIVGRDRTRVPLLNLQMTSFSSLKLLQNIYKTSKSYWFLGKYQV